MPSTIKPKTGTTTPAVSTLVQNELAVDTANKRIFIGASDGSGTLIGSAPGGSDSQVQFNDGGFFSGDSGLTYNKTTDSLTISGDLAVNGADITTTSTATATLFNTNATVLNMGGTATSVVIGAKSGTASIRNSTIRVGGDTTATTLNTVNNGSTTTSNHLTLSPYGDLTIAPTADIGTGGDRPSLLIENDDNAAGRFRFSGGNVQLLAATDSLESTAPILLQFYDSDLTNYVALRASSSISTNNIYTLPASVGTANQVLQIASVSGNDATLQWATVSGGSGLTWSAVTADRSLTAEEGVLANKSSGTLTLTLPTTAALGKVIRVSGMQNTWRIAQNASQKIHFGKTTTTTGTGGYLENSNAKDAVELVCCVANLEWNVISSIGNITIV